MFMVDTTITIDMSFGGSAITVQTRDGSSTEKEQDTQDILLLVASSSRSSQE